MALDRAGFMQSRIDQGWTGAQAHCRARFLPFPSFLDTAESIDYYLGRPDQTRLGYSGYACWLETPHGV